MQNRKSSPIALALLAAVALLSVATTPAHAALSDTLGGASAVEYVFDHPKPTGPSRRVVVSIPEPGTGTGGSIRRERWDGTNWIIEVSSTSYPTDVLLDTQIQTERQQADNLNAQEEQTQLLNDAATTVRDRLVAAGVTPPTVQQLADAMNPNGVNGQAVFDITRK